ncbi:uncharacterized protein C10orf67, mitochondrial-like [Mustelus asterias]
MAAVTSPLESVHGNDQDLVLLLSYSSGVNRYTGSGPSDQLKVGFFKTDRATQTDVSDILQLKETSKDVEFLVKEIAILKRTVQSQTQLLKADYGKKLGQQSLELYNRINDHNSYLRNFYLQRIDVLRKSFKQQLDNEIARLTAGFKRYCSEMSAQNQTNLEDNFTIQDTLKQKDALISSLKEKLLQYEAHEEMHQINFDFKDDFEKEQLIDENEELKEQVSFLKKNAERMSEAIHSGEVRINELEQEIMGLREKTEKSLTAIRKLLASEEYLKIQLQAEESKRERMLETQKLKMETALTAAKMKMEEKERAAKELEESLKEKEVQLAKQIHISLKQKEAMGTEKEVCLVVEKVAVHPISRDQAIQDLEKLKKKEAIQDQLLESLHKQLDRTNRMWEKKFAIMKQSYHAIKDEMYLRCSLQRQAPILHCAFARYTEQSEVAKIHQEAGH